jgi:hypothetical protein
MIEKWILSEIGRLIKELSLRFKDSQIIALKIRSVCYRNSVNKMLMRNDKVKKPLLT